MCRYVSKNHVTNEVCYQIKPYWDFKQEHTKPEEIPQGNKTNIHTVQLIEWSGFILLYFLPKGWKAKLIYAGFELKTDCWKRKEKKKEKLIQFIKFTELFCTGICIKVCNCNFNVYFWHTTSNTKYLLAILTCNYLTF